MATTAPTVPIKTAIPMPMEQIVEFCRRWKLTEFSLFGSVLRDDFGPDSDVDVLIDYPTDLPYSLKHWFQMQDELEALFGRKVDLIGRRGIERSRNPHRRRAILESVRVVHAA
jgi:predicted nucleotidyltransferase